MGGIKVGSNLSINNGVLSATDTNTTYFGGTNISLSGTTFNLNNDITLNDGSDRKIEIDQSTSVGNNLTVSAGKGAQGDSVDTAGKIGGNLNLSAGSGGDGYDAGNNGQGNGVDGLDGNVNISGTNVNITHDAAGSLNVNKIKSRTNNSDLILDTAVNSDSFYIQFQKALISTVSTDLRLTTKSGTYQSSEADNIVLTAADNNGSNNNSRAGSVRINAGVAPHQSGNGIDGMIDLNGSVINKTTKADYTQALGAAGQTVIAPVDLLKGFVRLQAGNNGSSTIPSDSQRTLKLPTATAIKTAIGGDAHIRVGLSFRFILRGEILTSANFTQGSEVGMYLMTNTGIDLYESKDFTPVSSGTEAAPLDQNATSGIHFEMSEFLCICTDASINGTTPKFSVYQLWRNGA